jgi:hypothetical protein
MKRSLPDFLPTKEAFEDACCHGDVARIESWKRDHMLFKIQVDRGLYLSATYGHITLVRLFLSMGAMNIGDVIIQVLLSENRTINKEKTIWILAAHWINQSGCTDDKIKLVMNRLISERCFRGIDLWMSFVIAFKDIGAYVQRMSLYIPRWKNHYSLHAIYYIRFPSLYQIDDIDRNKLYHQHILVLLLYHRRLPSDMVKVLRTCLACSYEDA